VPQYGFGHEEWLFNPRYRLNGFQYGYIRGVEKASIENEMIDEVYLYTKDPYNDYFLVGILKNVIRLNKKELKIIINNLFIKHIDTAIYELKEVNGDINELRRMGVNPTLKFKWDEANIFEEPIPISIDDSKHKRYQPYKLTADLEHFVKKTNLNKPKLVFKSGKTQNKSSYTLSKNKGKREVEKLHVDILEDLYRLLLEKNELEKLSVEQSTVNAKIIDLLEKQIKISIISKKLIKVILV